MGKICQKYWEEIEKKQNNERLERLRKEFQYSNNKVIEILDKYKPCLVLYKEIKEEVIKVLDEHTSAALHQIERGLDHETTVRRFQNQLNDTFK
jgi:hypothetical protein